MTARRLWSRLAVLAVVVAAFVLLRFTAFAPAPVPVRTVAAGKGRVEETVTNSRAGSVKARRRAKLAPETGGKVLELPRRRGAVVRRGDLLLRRGEHGRAWREERTALILQGDRLSVMGTGSAHIPRAIVTWGREALIQITVAAVDGNPVVLAAARAACRDWPEIHLEHQDLRALSFEPGSFDLVLCSLTLHHVGQADAVTLLRRINEIARVGFVLNDLRRNWCAISATDLLARTVLRCPILRHDAPQSCRAAFTVGELRDMARRAGLEYFQVNRHHAMFRMVLFWKK